MNKYIVYKHIFPNNKVYIGITSQNDVQRRWGKYGGGYNGQILMRNAIKKYGWDNIKHDILYYDLSEEEAKQKEIELIKLYNSTDKRFGYNISYGGNTVSDATKSKLSKIRKGHPTSEETRRKIGEANSKSCKGKIIPEEVRQKMRLSHLGKKYKPMSEEGKRNLSIAHKGQIISEETRKKSSEKNKGKIISEEQRRILSEKRKGKKLSFETRQKLSESLKKSGKERARKRAETIKKKYPNGYIQTPESNRKRSEKMKGRPKSEETKQKMRKPKSPEAVENMRIARKRIFEAKRMGITYKEYLTRMTKD